MYNVWYFTGTNLKLTSWNKGHMLPSAIMFKGQSLASFSKICYGFRPSMAPIMLMKQKLSLYGQEVAYVEP